MKNFNFWHPRILNREKLIRYPFYPGFEIVHVDEKGKRSGMINKDGCLVALISWPVFLFALSTLGVIFFWLIERVIEWSTHIV